MVENERSMIVRMQPNEHPEREEKIIELEAFVSHLYFDLCRSIATGPKLKGERVAKDSLLKAYRIGREAIDGLREKNKPTALGHCQHALRNKYNHL